MTISSSGSAPWRIFLIQILILVGILIFFRFYLHRREHAQAAQALTAREQRMNALFQNSIVEDTAREVSVPLNGATVKRHPQRLRTTYSPAELEAVLGMPDISRVDFRGGQHLIWNGTSHKLEAAFNAGHLFCLTWEDLTTHTGEFVYESDDQWHPY